MIEISQHFPMAPERAFDAWTDPRHIARWMTAPMFKMTGRRDEAVKTEVDARVGGKFSFVVRRDGQAIDHTGEYLEVDRPRRLAFSWGTPAFSPIFATVGLSFAPDGTGTRVTLTCTGVPDEFEERNRQGWTAILAAVSEVDG